MVSGNLSFVVSGNLKANTPAVRATDPKITNTKGGQIWSKLPFCIKSAIIPPNLAIQEQVPIAVFLITVGNNSEVYKYTIANPKAAANLPIITNTSCKVAIEGTTTNNPPITQQIPQIN